MKAKAQAKVAYDVATTEQIIDKPDSVLAMTCFNQAAGVSASKGGQIFSGDFTTELAPIVETALTDFYQSFGNADGFDTGTVNYTGSAVSLSNVFNCDEMKDLWNQTKTEGIQNNVPYATFNDLVSGTAPAGAGPDFTASWTAANGAGQNIFSNLNTAVGALPVPSVPNFSADNSSCKVLMTAGIIAGPCP